MTRTVTRLTRTHCRDTRTAASLCVRQVRGNDSEFVSASSDGSCIIWDMRRFVRNNSLFASTFFKAVRRRLSL